MPSQFEFNDEPSPGRSAPTQRGNERSASDHPWFRRFVVLLLVVINLQLFVPHHSAAERWEYLVAAPADRDFDDRIDELGRGGWELISARRATGGSEKFRYEMIFKRKR